jgi:hypothetical protein
MFFTISFVVLAFVSAVFPQMAVLATVDFETCHSPYRQPKPLIIVAAC